MPLRPLAATILDRLTEIYERERNPVRAAPMVAYMRDQFAYLGLPAPLQRTLNREVLAGLPRPSELDLADIATACWARPEREYQYFACTLLRRDVGGCSAKFLGLVRGLIVDKSWWDTVDTLASRVVGPLVVAHPRLVATMDAWAEEDNLWLTRTAILHQLFRKSETDSEQLFRYCTLQSGHRDFFIRKAIGWALREYAKTDPEAVRAFVATTPLSPLSAREALRRI
ncbi:MAG TPA: DNA alkylation repair protein [Micromonosporaceae bacterium]|jgi:3-methyladenine DNA glycosylase AlkD